MAATLFLSTRIFFEGLNLVFIHSLWLSNFQYLWQFKSITNLCSSFSFWVFLEEKSLIRGLIKTIIPKKLRSSGFTGNLHANANPKFAWIKKVLMQSRTRLDLRIVIELLSGPPICQNNLFSSNTGSI